MIKSIMTRLRSGLKAFLPMRFRGENNSIWQGLTYKVDCNGTAKNMAIIIVIITAFKITEPATTTTTIKT